MLSQIVDWNAVLDAPHGVSASGFAALLLTAVLLILGIAVGDMGLVHGLKLGQAVTSGTVSSTAALVIPFPGDMVMRGRRGHPTRAPGDRLG